MKPVNIQDIEKYPISYSDFITFESEKVLNYMNGMQSLADRYYLKYFKDEEDNKNLRLYQHTLTGLTGAKNAYATLGIMVENWGENGEWILATRQDAENYINEQDTPVEEVIEEINKLLDYTDVGM